MNTGRQVDFGQKSRNEAVINHIVLYQKPYTQVEMRIGGIESNSRKASYTGDNGFWS